MILGEIQLEHTFDAGHRIVGHKGKCARLHGHTYRAHVTVRGAVQDPGFVIDFGDVKDLINEWDHRMLLWEEDTYPLRGYSDVIWLPFNPTAENMAYDLAGRLFSFPFVYWVEVKLWETPKACAVAIRY